VPTSPDALPALSETVETWPGGVPASPGAVETRQDVLPASVNGLPTKADGVPEGAVAATGVQAGSLLFISPRSEHLVGLTGRPLTPQS